MKEKLRSKSFWISLVSAALVFLQAVGIRVDVPAVNEIVSALLTVLVVLGIVANPSSGSGGAGGGAAKAAEDMTSDVWERTSADGANLSPSEGGKAVQ